jgi:hypothetical protein
VTSQSQLVELIQQAYAREGFLANPKSYMVVRSAPSAQALTTLKKSLRGTPLGKTFFCSI